MALSQGSLALPQGFLYPVALSDICHKYKEPLDLPSICNIGNKIGEHMPFTCANIRQHGFESHRPPRERFLGWALDCLVGGGPQNLFQVTSLEFPSD